MTAEERSRRGAGLAVAAAVALLVAASVLALEGYVRYLRRRRTRITRRVTQFDAKNLMMALALYKRELGMYPPDDITFAGASPVHGMSEAPVYYLGRKRTEGTNFYGPYIRFKESRLTDEDGDGFQEYCDPWGGPWLYAENASHSTPTGMNPKSYDLVSAGPDGKLGGTISPATGYVPASTPEARALEEDNVTNWVRPASGRRGGAPGSAGRD